MTDESERHNDDKQALKWQRAFAFVSGFAGCMVLLATVGFPILGAWGFTGAGNHELHSPWPLWLGLLAGSTCGLVSAAFAQVALGKTIGTGVLRVIVRRFGGSVNVEVHDNEGEGRTDQ